ncbi:MAG TPA: hypothetical protein VK788_12880, partial [Terriglobales bacterium]|nr:hypothetical protein [Terriglobales bacterium]
EQKSLIKECGWKGGDSGDSGDSARRISEKQNPPRNNLTPTGLLMEGDSTSVRPFVRQRGTLGDHRDF